MLLVASINLYLCCMACFSICNPVPDSIRIEKPMIEYVFKTNLLRIINLLIKFMRDDKN